MTAIAGVFNHDSRPAERVDLERLARALAPYGRVRQDVRTYDEAGFAVATDVFTPEDVGQVQPVLGGGGRYAMIFDGRIDNRDEVAAALGLDPAEHARLSDAALAMRSFERWGESSFLRWIADFALAIWDFAERRLMLARDPFGYRPLCYHGSGKRFAFASMPPVLLALPWVPRELDERTLADAMSQLPNRFEATFYKDISLCPAGTIIAVDSAGVRQRRYYDLDDRVKPIRHRRDADYVEEARALFETAVRARLRSTGPVGSFMSGGLDSSTTAVFAAEQLAREGKRLPVFTSVPEEGWDGRTETHCYGDETPYVRAIAERHPALDLHLIRAEGLSHYHRQDDLLRLSGTPTRGAGNLAWIHAILEAARSRGIKVMLGGDNGNMTLSYRGDDIYNHLLGRGAYRRLWRELRLTSSRDGRWLPRVIASHLVVQRLPERLWERLNRVRGGKDLHGRYRQVSAADPAFGAGIQVLDRARAAGWNFFGHFDPAGRRSWKDMMIPFRASFAPLHKALGTLHGIDERDPFGDRRIVEWCFGVPEDQFHRDGTGRWLIKRMMADLLPTDVLHKKRDVGRQTSDWHLRMSRERGRMLADLETMGDDEDLSRMIDLPRLRSLLEDWPEQTVVDAADDRSFYLPVCVPMGLQMGRFIQLYKGANV